MSPLRATAARPDRRDGGRHGRSSARTLPNTGRQNPPTPPPEARIRPRLVRASLLPAVVAALGGAAAVLFTLRSTGARPSTAVWIALAGSAVLTVVAVAAAALRADHAARSVLDRCHALRRATARSQNELRAVVEQLRRGERPARRTAPPPAAGGDEFDLLAQELGRSHDAAVAAVVQASRLSTSVGNEQKVEVFVNLARRLQSLVHREIQLLDELENEVEDPELLKGLFHVDHLATRIRRHAENLAVLGGAMSRRQWSNPVSMTEVLRSSIAEVEQYPRVKLVPPIDGTLRGHAVADVIHLLAELVENATLFSAPHTTVVLRAQYVTAGLAVEVEDRGLGMPLAEQEKMNALLSDPDQVNVAHLLQDGRIGLYVVAALARRHGIAVRLQSNIYGGVQAVLVVPRSLLGADANHPQQPDQQQTGKKGVTSPTATPTAGIPAPAPAPAPEPGHGPALEPVTVTAADHLPRQPRHAATARPAAPAPTPPPPPPQAPPAHTPSPSPSPSAPHHPHTPHSSPAPAPVRDPAPLPVRGEHTDRPDSSAGRPGPQQPAAVPLLPQLPADGTGGLVEERPRLPKRRAQEHLVPQLRDEPAPRRYDEPVLHDPGLMAAFRRGIGLAESMPPNDPAPPFGPTEPQRHDEAHKE
ncbi:ATP-binding protein [Streptomyces sp. TRM49041]|uniref:sensor histidine kinase n=1 Tax=Streptomyces sp. TRM49041 TaxID=2603216 RepID=UPI0011ED7E24|nr:ATP-binding protein [Streptomyces sp. TRM49041]